MTTGFYINTFFLCTLYSFACLCAGSILMNLFGRFSIVIREISPLNYVFTSFLLGSGILTNIWALVLSVSQFHRASVGSILFICLLFGIRNIWQIKNKLLDQLSGIKKGFSNEPVSWKIIIILAMLMIILTGVRSFMPLSYYSDATAFYMVLPKLLIANQQWSFLRGYEAFSTIGLHGELHYAALMTLGSDWGAKLFNWPISLSCAALLAALAAKTGVGRRGQWLVIVMVFSSTAFTKLIGSGKVDIFAAAMGIAAIYWIIHEYDKPCRAEKLLAGLFAGFAVIAKISYLPLIVPCMILLIAWQNNYSSDNEQYNFKCFTISIIILACGILLPMLVHFLKNWVLFHEPFAPFIYFSESHAVGSWASQEWISTETIKKLILTYPLALTYGEYPFQMGTMSKLYLAFTPLILLIPRKNNLLKNRMFQISLAGIAGIIIWTVIKPGVFAPRYILYTLLLLTPVIAAAAEFITLKEKRKSCISASIVCVCILCMLFSNLSYAHRMKRRIKKKSTFDSSVYLASKKMNEVAKTGDRVYSLNYYTYWYSSNLLQSMSQRENESIYFNTESSSKTWESLFNNGFRFVFINRLTHKSIAETFDDKQTPEWLDVKIIYNEKDILLYHLSHKY